MKITGVETNNRNDKEALAYTVQKPPHKYYSGLKYKQEKFIFGDDALKIIFNPIQN